MRVTGALVAVVGGRRASGGRGEMEEGPEGAAWKWSWSQSPVWTRGGRWRFGGGGDGDGDRAAEEDAIFWSVILGVLRGRKGVRVCTGGWFVGCR